MTDNRMISLWAFIRNYCAHSSLTIFLLALIVTLPFTGKAFNIDDSLYVEYGRYLVEHPRQPFDFSFVQNNIIYERSDRMTHPPFLSYCYAVLFFVLPEAAEREIRLLQIAFFILFLFSFRRLATIFLQQTDEMVILTCISPAIVLAFQTAMADGPALALGIAGLATTAQTRFSRQHSNACEIIGGIMLTAAWLTAYQMLILSLLNIQLHRLVHPSEKRVPWATYVSLGIFLVFQAITWYRWGSPHIIQALQSSMVAHLSRIDITVSFLAQLGGTLLMPVVMMAIVFTCYPLSIFIFGLMVVTMSSLWYFQYGGGSFFICQLTLLTATGGLLLTAILLSLFRGLACQRNETYQHHYSLFKTRGHNLFWLLWMGLFLFFALGLASFSAVRYTIFFAPVMLIVGQRMWTRCTLGRVCRQIATGTLFLATLALTIVLSSIDYHFAESYRSFYQSPLMRQLGQSGHHIYTIGKFGLEHYGREAGLLPYVKNQTVLRRGDILLEARYCGTPLNAILSEKEQLLVRELVSIPVNFAFPLRMVHEDGAGFYCSMVGPLPYIISAEPLEIFTLSIISGDG